MERVQRRRYDPYTGLVKKPATAFNAEQLLGAVGFYLRCMACGHKGEIPMWSVDPEIYVPDIGIGRVCSKCGCTEIESWPKLPTIHGKRIL